MFKYLTLVWSRDRCSRSMNKDDHFPIVGFCQQAFLYNVRFLLTHPVNLNLYCTSADRVMVTYFTILKPEICEKISQEENLFIECLY